MFAQQVSVSQVAWAPPSFPDRDIPTLNRIGFPVVWATLVSAFMKSRGIDDVEFVSATYVK